MRYPKLVRPAQCKTDITILIEASEMSEDGDFGVLFEGTLKCNWQESINKVVFAPNKEQTSLAGIALFDGDVFDQCSDISHGSATVNGQTHNIVAGAKVRNPDGSINYTRLELG